MEIPRALSSGNFREGEEDAVLFCLDTTIASELDDNSRCGKQFVIT